MLAVLQSPQYQVPQEFKCSRCGYCCKEWGPELDFSYKDMELWAENIDWMFYHPLIDWYLHEFVSVEQSGFSTVKRAKQALSNAELEYEKEWGIVPDPFPFGGTLWYCPFLKWVGNKWGCLIHDYKSETCRTYLCYWDRLRSAFKSIFK